MFQEKKKQNQVEEEKKNIKVKVISVVPFFGN